jgi:hypothetical protein
MLGFINKAFEEGSDGEHYSDVKVTPEERELLVRFAIFLVVLGSIGRLFTLL